MNLTIKQKQILDGLKQIGDEAASFFEGALRYYYDASLPNRVAFMAHAAREIDASLRSFLAPKREAEETKKKLSSASDTVDFAQQGCEKSGHLASILVALDVPADSLFAKEWFDLATTFPKFAHRSGVGRSPRDFSEFASIWESYENILLKLVGSFYSILNRIDRISKLPAPPEDSVNVLLNFIKSPVFGNYFFGIPPTLGWFDALSSKGAFEPELILEKDRGWFWPPLDYLEQISKVIKQGKHVDYSPKLLEIIYKVTEYRDSKGNPIDNYFIWFKFVSILSNLENEIIHAFLKANKINFEDWLEVWLSSKQERSLAASDLMKVVFPKFNTKNIEDVQLAERIVTALLKTYFSESKDYDEALDSERKKAHLRSDIFWVNEGLFKNQGALKLGEVCSIEFIKNILNQLRLILKYKHFDHQVNLPKGSKSGECRYRLVLRRGEREGELVEGSYVLTAYKITKECYETVQKDDLRKAMRSTDIGDLLFDKHIIQGCFSSAHFIDAVYAKVRKILPKELADDAIVVNVLKELYRDIDTDFSCIWARSLERNGRESERGVPEFMTAVSIQLLKGRANAGKRDLEEILNQLLTEEFRFPTFRRMILFIAGQYFDQFGNYFYSLLKIQPNLLYSSHFKVELYDFFRTNAAKFEGQEEALLRIIESVPDEYLALYSEEAVKYKQLENINALSELDFFSKKSNQMKADLEIAGDIDPPQRDVSVVWSGSGASFYPEEWFLTQPNSEISRFFENLKDEERWGPNQKTIEGTGEVFQVAIKKNPNKFDSNLTPFVKAELTFVYHLIEGLKDAWVAKNHLNWAEIFDFINIYMVSENFRNPKVEKNSSRGMAVKPEWIISSIAGLLMSSTDDDKPLPAELFESCERLFKVLLSKRWGEVPETADIQESINTSLGRTIEAYINFSLLKARSKAKSDQPKDFNQEFYDSLLTADKPEAFTFVGRYLANFAYLSREWLLKKIEDFKKLEKTEKHWKGFFQGYVWSTTVYIDLFERMRDHYIYAIQTQHDYEQVQGQIADHAVLVYLYCFKNETLANSNSLIRILLDFNDIEIWKLLLNSIWSIGRRAKDKWQSENSKKEKKAVEKAREFWVWFFENLIGRFDEQAVPGLFSIMCRLAFLFDDLQDLKIVNHFKIIAPCADRHRDSAFFIENLDKYSNDDDVQQVADIYLAMLTGEGFPDYDKNHIKSIVSKIYKAGVKDKADQIVSFYANRGQHFLRDIWNDNNK